MVPALRVLFFLPSLGGGGAEMQALRLLLALDRRVATPSLAVARGGGSYEARLPDDVRPVVCTQGIRSSLGSVGLAIPKLRRLIAERKPHVVVSLLEHASLALSLAVLGLRARPRVVLGIQNNFSVGMSRAPLPERLALRPAYLAAYQRADHVVALSRGVAEDLARASPGLAARTTVVYNAGLDEALFERAAQPLHEPRPDGPLVVACGRLVEQKDFSTLLEAFALLRERRPAPHLWVLGEGPLRGALQAQAVRLGVLGRVRWLGFRDNPLPFFAAADLFVLSSRWEGFANVVVEALACGTPVVSTDCPYGPGEILEGGRYGTLVPVAQPERLAQAIDDALATGKTPELSARARARARSFDAEASARGYEAVFARVVREAP